MSEPTAAVGVSVDETGRIIAQYIDKDGQRQVLDLTAEIERIAEEKVQAHMKAWHGHQL